MSSPDGTSYYANYHPKGKAPEISDKNIIQTLQDFHMVARNGDWTLFLDIWRQIQWGIIKGLAWSADSISMASTGVLHFLSFYTYQPVIDFLAQYQVYIILASFAFFGIAWIGAMSKKEIPIVDMLKSGAFAWFTFFVLPVLMMVATGAVQNFAQAISTHDTPSSTIIKNNIVDVRALDSAHWDVTAINKLQEAGNGAPNFINTQKNKNGDLTVQWEELNYIDPTARMLNKDEEKLSEYGQKVTSKKIDFDNYLYKDDSGTYTQKKTLVDLDNNMFKEDGHYYTYYWNFWTIVISFLASIIFTTILLLRMVRLEANIFLSWTVGNAISLSQWSSTKRNWEVLSKIGMGFTTLLFTQALGVLFNLGLSQLTAMLQKGSINFVEFVVLVFGFGMELIDGPALWQQLFGIDAGIKSGWQNLWGGVMLMKSLNDTLNPLSNQRRMRRAMEGNKNKNNKQSDDSQENPEQKESKFKNFFKGADSKSQNENPEDKKAEQRENQANPKASTQQKEEKPGVPEEPSHPKAETKATPSSPSEEETPEKEKQASPTHPKAETKSNPSAPLEPDSPEAEEKQERPEPRQQPKEAPQNHWEANNNPFEQPLGEMADFWGNNEPPQENPEYHN